MQNSVKWYHKGFALIAMICSMFMFILLSSSYANTMKWIDVQLGKSELRASQGITWLKAAVSSGIEVDAITVEVVADFPRIAEDLLVQGVSTLLTSVLGNVGEIFSELVGKIQEMSGVFASIGEESGNMFLAIQSTVWPQIEKKLSSCEIADNLLGSSIGTDERSTMCDAIARLRFAEVAQQTADPTAPADTVPTSQQIDQAKTKVAEAAQAACNSDSELQSLPFSDILGVYTPGCASDVQTKVAQAVASDVTTVNSAITTLQNRAPADCKQPFADFTNTSFNNYSIYDLSTVSAYTSQLVTSDFLNDIGSFSGTTQIELLTPDECASLQSSSDAALAGAQVTPPSNAGAAGLGGVIQTFIDTVTKLISDLINSVIKIALDALNSVFNSFPRIFSEGFSQLVGNFSSVISTNLSTLTSGFETSYDPTTAPYAHLNSNIPILRNNQKSS